MKYDKLDRMHIQQAHSSIISGGNPSVFFRVQLCHICGISWMHQSTVPIVPSTFEASVTLPASAIVKSHVDIRGSKSMVLRNVMSR